MDRRIIILRKQILDNLQGRWTVRSMAKAANLSGSHLRTIFKDETGKTPTQFLREIRLEKARGLLIEGLLHIKEISVTVGFGNQNLIYEKLQKVYGVTPSKYRENYWKQLENDLINN